MGIISNALPIQWWPIQGKTYNESKPGFVRPDPYIHEWQCDDPIKDQIGSEIDPSKEYSFIIKDRNGSNLAVLPYVKTMLQGPLITPILSIQNDGFIGTLTPFTQDGGNAAWIWSADGQILSDGTVGALTSTNYLRFIRPDGYSVGWPIGHYRINLTNWANHSAANVNYEITGSNDGGATNTILYTSAPIAPFFILASTSFTFDTTQYWKSFAIRFYSSVTVIIPIGGIGHLGALSMPTSVFGTPYPPRYETLAEYDLEFTGLDESICDQYVQFFINASDGGSLDEETLDSDTLDTLDDANNIYKSDFHLFRTLMPIDPYNGSQLIYYKQATNYASLNYPNNGNYFALRIPCKFFTEREVETQTSIDLTSKSIDTSSFIKYQRSLQIPVLPDYMLKKIGLALAHSKKGSVIIDGLEWTQQEAINRSGPSGDIKYPKQMADVWLTDKNAGVRNII